MYPILPEKRAVRPGVQAAAGRNGVVYPKGWLLGYFNVDQLCQCSAVPAVKYVPYYGPDQDYSYPQFGPPGWLYNWYDTEMVCGCRKRPPVVPITTTTPRSPLAKPNVDYPEGWFEGWYDSDQVCQCPTVPSVKKTSPLKKRLVPPGWYDIYDTLAICGCVEGSGFAVMKP